MANGFRNAIRVIRSESSDANHQNPLIILGHSLGGIITKEALIKMKDGDNHDQANFKATYALLFFGVPNRGMEIRHFTPIVHNAPNRYLVEVLGTGSDFLREQSAKFPIIFHFKDSEIISYYETEETPTAQMVDDKWERTGKTVLLVPYDSAIHSRPWELTDRYLVQVNRDHSEMVKFSERPRW
ncbi:hypothetical protein CDD83_5119 [Cordyceps sp. RAO-2017]|nr:hypothetical protein CDD83_5119 [Cordyceps sp. RAO-2017]